MTIDNLLTCKQYSQFDCEPVLHRLLKPLGVKGGYVVEIGAWNGTDLSNSAALIRDCGWRGLLIERNRSACEAAGVTYKDREDVAVKCAMVTLESINELIDGEPDVVSIDVDGNDLHFLQAMEAKPSLIICEYNAHREPGTAMAYDSNFMRHSGNKTYGASRESVRLECERKGYRVVYDDGQCNLFALRNNPSIKLHLGCGDVYLPDWVNIDIRRESRATLFADATLLPRCRERTVAIIYASHLLEHVGRHHVLKVLSRWYDLLQPNGVLRLSVPDFAAIAEQYKETGNLAELTGLLYGGQNYDRNAHKIAFDETTLVDNLREVGFTSAQRYDWRFTEHAEIDDYSQCYLPHLDRENGRLMSLNMEAVK